MSTELKTCSKCKQEQPATLEYFGADSRMKSGLQSRCRNCEKKRSQARIHKPLTHDDHVRRHEARKNDPIYRAKRLEWDRARRQTPKYKAARKRRYEAKKKGTGVSIADVCIRFMQQDGKCYYCGSPVYRNFHIDHIKALAKGGEHSPGNIVISCPKCNQIKGSKDATEFRV